MERAPRGAAFIGSVPEGRLAPPRRGQGAVGRGREEPLPAPPLRLVPRLPLPHLPLADSKSREAVVRVPWQPYLFRPAPRGEARESAAVRKARSRRQAVTVRGPARLPAPWTRHTPAGWLHETPSAQCLGSLTTRRARRSPRAVLPLAQNPRNHRSTPGPRHLLLSAQLPRHTLSLSPHLLSALGEGEAGKW